MSHGMENRDRQFSLQMEWHGLTNVVENITGFWFEVLRQAICLPNSSKESGFDWLVSSEDGLPIGKPQARDSFRFQTNEQLMQSVRNAMSFFPNAYIASLGTFDNLAKRYVSVKVGESKEHFEINGHKYFTHFNFQDALDGTMRRILKGSITRIVCQNTFNISLGEDLGYNESSKHTKNHDIAIERVEERFEAIFNRSREFELLMQTANEVQMSDEKARNVFLGWLSEGKEVSSRTLNTAERVRGLFIGGKGNEGRTGLDLINGVTDYYSHESSGGDDAMKQFTSSEIGNGARVKETFLSDIRTKDFRWNKQAVAQLAKMGEETFAKSAS